MEITQMKAEHYDEVYALWSITSKRALRADDDRQGIERFLGRNEGLSQIAVMDGKIVGTVLAGHDGRRGFLYHVAVLPEYRRHGIAAKMVSKAIESLENEGIKKTNIFVFKDNALGQAFWSTIGWGEREDLSVYQFEVKGDKK